MSSRSYSQVCGLARSLDLLGERWTLLIVRELLLGPKRFGALEATLPGIGPNLLSARLASLTDEGIVERAQLAPPAAVSGYRLTELGEGLREPLEAMAIWGFGLLEPEEAVERGDVVRASWLAGTLAASAAREPGPTKAGGSVVNFDVDGDRFYVAVDEDRAHVRHGERPDAAAALSCDMRSFYEMAQGARTADDPEVARVLAELVPAS